MSFYQITVLVLLISLVVLPGVIFAQVDINKNIRLEPARFELLLNPGESTTFNIKITNNLEKKTDFNLSIEDFEGTEDGSESLVLLGDNRGRFSLKDAVSYPVDSFSLDPNESVLVPITVSIPEDSANGGLFASVLFTVDKDSDVAVTGTNVETRVGALIFVRVGTEGLFSGETQVFETLNSEKVFINNKPSFVTTFRNNGNVHLNPYGGIQVRNMFGRIVEKINIDPWFVLPGSMRTKVVESEKKPLFGFYKATLELNRGYDDIVDTKEVSFVVISWRFMLSLMTLLLVGLFSFRAYKLKQYAQES